MTAVWEPVIGIETHVELQTRSKMFCGCEVTFGADPNTTCCPVCLGLPGALPVPNEAAMEGILRIGAALGCTLVDYSEFHRKNYFYPDLPKGYQISQYDLPLCIDGSLAVSVDGEHSSVGITRVHMEEDTGKSRHLAADGRIHDAAFSLLDFNRSGVPLVEIVSEPDIRTADQARAYAVELQRVVKSLGVSDARLEQGSMRFDVNRLGAPEGCRRARYENRGEERQLAALDARRHRVRDRQTDRSVGRGRRCCPGDATLARGSQPDGIDALQRGIGGLPVFPGARSRADRGR